MQDLETAVREGLDIKIVILNDFRYRVLNFRQKLQFGGRIIGTEHNNPDFAQLARCFGATGYRLDSPEQVDQVLDAALAAKGPVVVDVLIDPDDVPPMNAEATLRMSAAKHGTSSEAWLVERGAQGRFWWWAQPSYRLTSPTFILSRRERETAPPREWNCRILPAGVSVSPELFSPKVRAKGLKQVLRRSRCRRSFDLKAALTQATALLILQRQRNESHQYHVQPGTKTWAAISGHPPPSWLMRTTGSTR
jgi:acetolactate synthase-1/2/3 large subunit